MGKIATDELRSLLSEISFDVQLYVKDCLTGEEFAYRADEKVPSASTIKVPLLALLLKDAYEGHLEMDVPRSLPDINRVGGSGLLRYLSKEYKPTLRDLALLMITVSDNAATNEIIDAVGIDRFNQTWKEWGCCHTGLNRKMMDRAAILQGKDNFISAFDAGRILDMAARGELFSKAISDELFQILCRQKLRNRLPLLLPVTDEYDSNGDVPPGKVMVANKTGSVAGVNNDIGIFELPNHHRYIMAVYTHGFQQEADAVMLIAKLSKAVYDGLKD